MQYTKIIQRDDGINRGNGPGWEKVECSYGERWDRGTIIRHTDKLLRNHSHADMFRALLIDAPDFTGYENYVDENGGDDLVLSENAFNETCDALVFALDPNNLLTETITELCIAHSLCPMHRIDWAICFDDAEPECDQIRNIYPNSHDT